MFLAQDLRHERPVALKVLHPEIAATLGPERFKQEILLAARLQHPHILGVYDSGEAGGHLWFTMPFVEGESLRDRLNHERQIGVDDAVRIAQDVAGALDYAHRRGIIHRDIKPANILLSDRHALVGDFGIARAIGADALTQTGLSIGTPAYMSPEQAAGGDVDARTDIYSLACVLYEMLVGEPPFSGPNTAAVISRVMTETPRPIRATRPRTPAAVDAAVSRAMARVPADRFASAAEFALALTPSTAEATPPIPTVTLQPEQERAGRGHIFVSYSRRDLEWVQALVTELEAAGLPVWLDVHKLKPGVVWDSEIELALRGTDVLLVILSENSGASTNVLDEINFALSKNRLVVPVLYQTCDIPYRLARLQHIDFTGPREVALQRLIERLRAATTPGGSAPFAAAPPPTEHPPVPAETRASAPAPMPAPSTISPAVPVPSVADARAPRVPWQRRRFVSNFALVLFIVAAFVAWYRYSSVTAGTRRLAVLPFENLGAATDEYFADGMTDEVRGKLAALDDLQVTARSSAMQYKKAGAKTPEQIGRELGVDFLLTGTVRWEGAGGTRRVRVSPELIRVSDGTARWQQAFDTEMNDVFQVQADIASRVAQALDVALGASTKQQLSERPTANLAAYDAFLRGEQESQSGTLSDAVPLRKAIVAYEQAVALDPEFGQSWAQLSRAACSNASSSPTPEDIELCRRGAERAVALAPNRPESRLAMGLYYRFILKDFDKSLEQYTIGLRASPNNADLLAGSAIIERTLGRFEEALPHLERAARLDPRSVSAANSLARTYHDLHRHAEAQTEYSRALVFAPTNLALVQAKAGDLLSQGDLAGAREVIATALQHTSATAIIVRFTTFQEMMWALPDELRNEVVNLQPANFDNNRAMWALKMGATYRLMGDTAKAKSYGEIAAGEYAKIAARYPDDAQQMELLGRSLALTDRKAEAVQAGERSLAMREATMDAVSGPYYQYQVARICLQVGRYDRALDLIEPLLSKPGDTTPGWLRIDPIFTPLRGNPRFERLVKYQR